MKDFSQGKIYTIRNRKDPTLIYVGSTVQPLSHRWGNHKLNIKNNKCCWENIDNNIENWYIELHENFPCKSNEELHKREGEVIRAIGSINIQIAGRTKEEYRKEEGTNCNKRYYEKHKLNIRQYHTTWRDENKDHLKNYNRELREKNKEQINNQKKKYYEENNQIVLCECGGHYIKCCGKNRHEKSKKHLIWLKKNDIRVMYNI